MTAAPRIVALALVLAAALAASSRPTASWADSPTASPGFGGAGVLAFGDAGDYGSPAGPVSAPIEGMAATPDTRGYWLVAADGGVFSFGDAEFYGSAGGLKLSAPIVGLAPTPDGRGYWLVALDGGIFNYGDAGFYGSTGGQRLNEPIVGMAPAPDGRGYWLVASDGGVFSFGDASFHGSTGGVPLNGTVVGMAPAPDGRGYWLVAGDGGIFSFGDAPFHGSAGGQRLAAPVAGMAATADGGGYWLVGSDGGVFAYGDASFLGSDNAAVPTPPIAAIVPTRGGGGYWLLSPDAIPTGFDHPSPAGPVARAIVEAAAGQVGGNPASGYLCNPYGPCVVWCALFDTWAWQQAGLGIPSYAFTGDIYQWAAGHGALFGPGGQAGPGDIVLYGTGPDTVDTSVHAGIVAQVWPDGAVITVEGDSGPGPPGHHNVTINGPFLPSDSPNFNGYPVYAFAAP
jgi:hypothetical protein